jgi:hypothetical protein
LLAQAASIIVKPSFGVDACSHPAYLTFYHNKSGTTEVTSIILLFKNPPLFCLIFAALMPLGEKGGIGKSL